MTLNKNILASYFSFLLVGLSFSQEKQQGNDTIKIKSLDEVIVTATRTLRQLSSLPMPVQLISSKEIKAINSRRLSDVLNEQTGLTIVNDHGQGIQMQGMDSDYTLILIDGVPLIGRTAGTLDLSRVTVGNIKQIEIVKGASSSLYGNEALAGVINIITEDPVDGFKGTIDYSSGTNTTNDLGASINYKKNKLGITAFVNSFSSHGFDLTPEDGLKNIDPYHNYTLSSKIKYDFSKKTTLVLSGKYYTEKQDYIPSKTLRGEGNVNEWSTFLKLKHKHNEKWETYIDFYKTQYKTDSYLNNLDGTLYSESDFNQIQLRPELRVSYQYNQKNTFTAGIGTTYESLERTYFSNKPEINSPFAHVQYDTRIGEKLNIILGARFDNHSEYKSQLSPKLAMRYDFNSKIAIKASVGYGYKAPGFRQLYLDFTNSTAGYSVIGYNRAPDRITELYKLGEITETNFSAIDLSKFNGALIPESSVNYNFGIALQPLTKLKLELNFFRNNIDNLINTIIVARKTNGSNLYSYENVSRVYNQGLELNTTWMPTANLKISGGYQLLYAKDKDAEEAHENGEVFIRDEKTAETKRLTKDDYFGLPNRSKHMANAKVFYTNLRWKLNANIRATYRSDYGLRDTNSSGYIDHNDEFVDGYNIIDFAINKTILKKYTLGLTVDNIFDFTDPTNINTIAGRLIYGKITIQF